MGFLSVLSGLGGAAGGVAAGLKEKQDLQLQKAQTEEIQQKAHQAFITNIQNQITADPSLKTNPNYNKLISNYAKQYKVQVPMRADGAGIDWDAFAPKQDSLAFIKDNYGLSPTQIKEASPDVQAAIRDHFPNDPTIQQLVGKGTPAQAVPLMPHSVDEDKRLIITQIDDLASGKLTVPQFDSIVKGIAGTDDSMKVWADDLVNSDPNVIGALGAKTKEDIQHLIDIGAIDKKKYDLEHLKFENLEDFRKFQEEHFKHMDEVSAGNLRERIANDQERWTKDKERTDFERERLRIAVQKAQEGGSLGYSAGQIDKSAVATRRYITSLQAELNSYQRESQQINAQGDAPPPELTKHIEALKTEIDKQQKVLGDYTSHEGDVRRAILQGAGATPKNPNTPPADSSEPKVHGTFSNGQKGYKQGSNYYLLDGTKVDENGKPV